MGRARWARRYTCFLFVCSGLFGVHSWAPPCWHVVLGTQTKTQAVQRKVYDAPRDNGVDAKFASVSATYERAVAERKRALFEKLFSKMPAQGATVVEVGMGAFPNAVHFASPKAPAGLDIFGVDPNDYMESYARDSAAKNGLLEPARGNTLRIVHGVARALPLETGSVDVVFSCRWLLCSGNTF